MCGITGFVNAAVSAGGTESLSARLEYMTDALAHRGPDSFGYWYDRELGIGLGHRRLAILDLSAAGHQPMASSSGRYQIVFNGEIFNYLSIAKDLQELGATFRGTSDTEVMLAAFEQWGLDKSIERFVGMFAFALWDRQEHCMHLVRDRVGIKPLYYGWCGKSFLFASEISAFRMKGETPPDIDRNAVASLMRYGFIPAPHTIYSGVYKLPPGCVLRLPLAALKHKPGGFQPQPGGSTSDAIGASGAQVYSFWSLAAVSEAKRLQMFGGSDQEAVDHLEALLRDSVRLRLISDVPFGAFLSGGIDSSTVVALMQSIHSQTVKTFSIGFSEQAYEEAAHARAVAAHLGTEHIELYVSNHLLRDVVPQLPTLYSEPFADSSQIPTYLVSKLARTQVTVALSGDGGDELFAGYNRYVLTKRVWDLLRLMPAFLRSRLGHRMLKISPHSWDRLYGRFPKLLPVLDRPAERFQKLASVMTATSLDELYYLLMSQWRDTSPLVLGATSGSDVYHRTAALFGSRPPEERWLFLDQLVYLPDDNLTKVDRASMAVGLEVRVPLLDHRVVEFAASLPYHMKIRNGTSKWLLRQVLYRHVPKELIERPKMGFSVPIGEWMRGPLKGWAEDLLSEDTLRRQGYLDPATVRQCWKEHQSGTHNWQHQLWNVLMYQAWLSANS